MDIFRLQTGRIREHWDILQRTPDDAVHADTTF
jgi:predicted SnoaL-like aldol condensation-catalyzing enzyme